MICRTYKSLRPVLTREIELVILFKSYHRSFLYSLSPLSAECEFGAMPLPLWRSMLNRLVLGLRVLALHLCAFIFLAGCGGGGDSVESPTPPPSQPPPESPPPERACADWSGSLNLSAETGHSQVGTVAAVDDCVFIVSGFERSSHAGEPLGDTRGFIRSFRVDLQGSAVRQWEFLLDTPATDAIHGFEYTPEVIRFWGITTGALPGATNSGKKDVVLGSLSADGELMKISQVGNEKPNVPLSLLQTSEFDYVLVGNDEVYIPTNYVDTWEDPWFAYVEEYPDAFRLGQLTNRDTPGGDIYADALAVSDSVIVALRAFQNPDQGISVKRIGGSGELVWSQQFSPSPVDSISSVILRESDLLVLGSSYLVLGVESMGGADHFLASTDFETGEVLWLRQFGTPATDWAKKLLVSPTGLTVLGEVDDEAGNWSGVVYQLDSDAKVLSRQTFVIGESLEILTGSYVGDALLVGGAYRNADGRSVGFVQPLRVHPR